MEKRHLKKADPSSGSHPDSRLGGLCVHVSDVDWYLHLCCWMFILHKAAAQRGSVHAVSRSRSLSRALTLSHHPVTLWPLLLYPVTHSKPFLLIPKLSDQMVIYLFNSNIKSQSFSILINKAAFISQEGFIGMRRYDMTFPIDWCGIHDLVFSPNIR